MVKGLRYFKFTPGGIYGEAVIAVREEDVEELHEKFGKDVLQECGEPDDARLVVVGHSYKPSPFLELDCGKYDMFDSDEEPRPEVWDGPNCARCKNRHNTNLDWCAKHYKDSGTCYRFKLEK